MKFHSKSQLVLLLAAMAFLPGCSIGSPVLAWKNFQKKVHLLFTLESRHKILEEKYEELEKKYVELEHEYAAMLAEIESKGRGENNLKLTGSRTGRTIASIHYEVPKGLDNDAKLELAFQHMRQKRFAEAAATFDTFLWEPEGAALQTARNFYEAGVAWFEVKNLKKARTCFEAATAHAEGDEKKEIQRRVELWMRVLDKTKEG